MPVSIKGSGGGSVTLDAGAASADTTLTIPNTTGTVALTASPTLSTPTFTTSATVVGSVRPTFIMNSTASGSWKSAVNFWSNGVGKWEVGVDAGAVGNNDLYFYDAVANATRMMIDSSGSVGIGTTSPVAKLDVAGNTTGGVNSYVRNTNTTLNSFAFSAVYSNNGADYIQLLSYAQAGGYLAFNNTTGATILTANAQPLYFGTNNIERMRLDALGNLSVGTTTSLAKVTITSPNTSDILAVQTTATTGSPTGLVYKNGSGTIAGYVSINAASNTVTYTNSSDERLKTNPRDFSGLDLVSQMKPKKYERICQLGTDEIGLYAQELSGILPEAVSIGDEDVNKKPWGIDYGRITPVLIKAIQELSAKNDALEARLAALEAK